MNILEINGRNNSSIALFLYKSLRTEVSNNSMMSLVIAIQMSIRDWQKGNSKSFLKHYMENVRKNIFFLHFLKVLEKSIYYLPQYFNIDKLHLFESTYDAHLTKLVALQMYVFEW